MKTDMEALKSANWDEIECDVVYRLWLLETVCRRIESGELSDRIANDLILPCLRLLAEFVSCVDAENRVGVLSVNTIPRRRVFELLERLSHLAEELDTAMDGVEVPDHAAAILNGMRVILGKLEDERDGE